MLVSAALARTHIPSLTGTSEDTTILEPIIRRVDRLFAVKCGYPPCAPGAAPSMESRPYTLDLRAQSGRELDLEVYPVTSITAASIDASCDFEGDEDSVTLTDITLRGGSVARLLSTASVSWATERAGNRVSFIAGFNGSSTVTGAHTSSATTITVASTAAFGIDVGGGGRVVVGTEVIRFTARTATTLTGCTRGAEGTTAASILDGATISQPTPEDLEQLVLEAVRYLFDLRATQGKDSVTQGGSTTALRDLTRATGERDHLPDFILSGLGAYILPRAMA